MKLQEAQRQNNVTTNFFKGFLSNEKRGNCASTATSIITWKDRLYTVDSDASTLLVEESSLTSQERKSIRQTQKLLGRPNRERHCPFHNEANGHIQEICSYLNVKLVEDSLFGIVFGAVVQ